VLGEINRLRPKGVLGVPKLEVVLLTGRTIKQGVGKELGKLSNEYHTSVAICQMDSKDLDSIGIRENDNVRVTTRFGSVVLTAVESDRGPHPGVIYVPYGLWANVLTGSHTHGTGMPSFKGVPAEIEPAPREEVMGVRDLLQHYYGK